MKIIKRKKISPELVFGSLPFLFIERERCSYMLHQNQKIDLYDVLIQYVI